MKNEKREMNNENEKTKEADLILISWPLPSRCGCCCDSCPNKHWLASKMSALFGGRISCQQQQPDWARSQGMFSAGFGPSRVESTPTESRTELWALKNLGAHPKTHNPISRMTGSFFRSCCLDSTTFTAVDNGDAVCLCLHCIPPPTPLETTMRSQLFAIAYYLCIKKKVILCCGRRISRLRTILETKVAPFETRL